MSMWVRTSVRDAIVNSLGLIGDKRAVPVLKKYLKKPLKNDDVFTGSVAHALYRITGESYEYKDYDGVQKLYVPSPHSEEEFRKLSRPDLKPTKGLTATLEIEGHGPNGEYWVGDHPLVINLAIKNQSKKLIKIDASADNFMFSSVSGERTSTPANLLPSPEPDTKMAAIEPGRTFRLSWKVEILKQSPLSRGWIGTINIKCVYTSQPKNKSGTTWRGERLVSNSVERYYFPSN